MWESRVNVRYCTIETSTFIRIQTTTRTTNGLSTSCGILPNLNLACVWYILGNNTERLLSVHSDTSVVWHTTSSNFKRTGQTKTFRVILRSVHFGSSKASQSASNWKAAKENWSLYILIVQGRANNLGERVSPRFTAETSIIFIWYNYQ